MEWLDSIWAPPLVGLIGGVLLGLAARRGRFCTLGAIEDAAYGQDWSRLRMWALALAVAIAGTFSLAAAGAIDLTSTLYARTAWNPAGAIVGGGLFGYGMAIAGNCGYGALARLGGGDLRSFVIVVVMGLSAYMVLAGPLAGLRVQIFSVGSNDWLSTGYADLFASWLATPAIVPALGVAFVFCAWALSDRTFRTDLNALFWGVVVGLAIVSGWVGTTAIAAHGFSAEPVQSHSFTAPVGETMLYAMTGSSGGLSFSVGSVLGVVFGALIGSISQGRFRWEACDDPGELGRQILGGALMGVGGVLALGCSVGQGLTAFSTLAYSAPVVLGAIVLGALVGLRQLVRGFEPV